MIVTEPDTILIRLERDDVVTCSACGTPEQNLMVYNEPVVTEDGQIGIEAVVTFARCGHVVPQAHADPEKVAWVLEQEDGPYSI